MDTVLAGFVRPDLAWSDNYNPDEDAHEYGVSLVRSANSPVDDNTEIVRLDNAHGQTPHVDNVYLPPNSDEDEKTKLGEDWNYRKMRRFLLTEWRGYVDLFDYHQQ